MIKLIIFDLGKVILDFSYRNVGDCLATFSTHPEYGDPDHIMDYMFNDSYRIVSLYEEGQITSEDFFIHIRETFRLRISFHEFKRIWSEIFTEKEGIRDLIERVKKDFTLFLLSNTNELHFNYIKQKFPVVHRFDHWILSYETGVKKPRPEIYKIALDRAGVLPEEAIFIDDIQGHVTGAQDIGIHAVQFKSVEQITKYIEEKAYERFTE